MSSLYIKTMMESPETNIFFIRHGEHEKDPEKTSDERGLTNKGVVESRDIGRKISVDSKISAGFHAHGNRSMLSTLLSIYPNLKVDRPANLTQKTLKDKKIRPYSKLSYESVDDEQFSKALYTAGIERKILKFLVDKSDEFRKKSHHEITSYSIAASDVARIILKYDKLQSRRFNKEVNLINHQNLQRVFCAREFIFPCFRAKLTAILSGNDEKERYIDWYESNIEGREDSRREFSQIRITCDKDGENQLILSDSFGELVFNYEHLEKMVGETESSFEKIRVGVYLIPFNRKGEVAILKYPDGYGFIGGGVKRGESMMRAMKRELREELGMGVDITKLDIIIEPYSFMMDKGKRLGVPEHRENHFFFVTKFYDETSPLVFKEQGAQIEWIKPSELLNPKIINFADLREFIANNILPKLIREK